MTFKDYLKTLNILLLFTGLALLVGCASSPHKNLQEVKRGMDKSDVLEIAGNPTFSLRKNSRDIWIYRYYKEDLELRKTITFYQGDVVKIGPLRAPKHLRAAENANSIEEFEARIIEHRKQIKSLN